MVPRDNYLDAMSEPEADRTIQVSEPSQDDYKSWAVAHRSRLKEVLAAAGASEYFIRMVDTNERGTRHSVLMTLYRHAGDKEPTVEGVTEAYRLGGGFLTKLWDGHLADAFCHADTNNRGMMVEEFSEREIVSVGIESDSIFRDREYLERLIREKFERATA